MSATHTHHGNGPHRSTATATDDLKDKASQVGQDLREVAGAVRDVAGEQYENVRQCAADYVQHGRERVMEWEEGIEGYIKDNPVRSLLIAGGVGLLVGLFWRRR